MRILAAALLTVAVTASNASATIQMPDKIFYEGKKYDIDTYPMESYFSQHPDKKPENDNVSTDLWRGYVATFEVLDKSLALKDIEIETFTKTADGTNQYNWKSVKTTLVPEGQVLTIDSFTGLLELRIGALIKNVHTGNGSTYKNYILLEIKNGKLTGERKLDSLQYEQFRDKQFQAFKKTEEYKKVTAQRRKEGAPQESDDSYIRIFILEYTSKFLDEEASPKKP